MYEGHPVYIWGNLEVKEYEFSSASMKFLCSYKYKNDYFTPIWDVRAHTDNRCFSIWYICAILGETQGLTPLMI